MLKISCGKRSVNHKWQNSANINHSAGWTSRMSLAFPIFSKHSFFSSRTSESVEDGREAGPNLDGLLPQDLAQAAPGPETDETPGSNLNPKSVLSMMNRAVDALEFLHARCLGVEAKADEAAEHHARTLADAKRDAEAWKHRAASSEAQSQELETRLAAAEVTIVELRSRLVCLYGKLAASADTVRFQTMARALVDPAAGDVQGLMDQSPLFPQRLGAIGAELTN